MTSTLISGRVLLVVVEFIMLTFAREKENTRFMLPEAFGLEASENANITLPVTTGGKEGLPRSSTKDLLVNDYVRFDHNPFKQWTEELTARNGFTGPVTALIELLSVWSVRVGFGQNIAVAVLHQVSKQRKTNQIYLFSL